MEIQEFPIGTKNFKFEGDDANTKALMLVTKPDLIAKVNELSELIHKIVSLDSTAEYAPYMQELLNASRYPKGFDIAGTLNGVATYKLINPRVLSNQTEWIYTTKVAKATKYQRTDEFRMLGDLPAFSNMHVSVHPDMVTVYNMPYEGELVNSAKFKEVNKLITTKMKELSAQVQLTCMLSSDYMEIPKNNGTNNYYNGKVISNEELIPYFLKYMHGTSNQDDELLLANATGILSKKSMRIDGKHTQIFKMSSRKPKFPTGVRTRLYYMMGALELPENYMEWFDV
jgi:hypothetical protein